MQVIVEQTRVLTAVREPGVKPETPDRIYKLTLLADSEMDFDILAVILGKLKANAQADGVPIVEEYADEQSDKAQAAQFN